MKLEALVSIARVCCRAARGAEGPLRTEIRRALRSGVSPPDLREALLQTYLFAGFPRAITALTLLGREVEGDFHRENPKGLEEWRRRGLKLCRAVYGPTFPALMRNMERAHPDLAEWILVEGYGKTLSRPFLGLRERELIVVPTLAALAAWRQLPSHIGGALRAGAGPADIAAMIRACSGAIPAASVKRALRELGASRRRIVK